MRIYPNLHPVQQIKRICRKREIINPTDALLLSHLYDRTTAHKGAHLRVCKALRYAILPSVKGCEDMYYGNLNKSHCIAETDKPIIYIPVMYDGFAVWLGYDLWQLANCILTNPHREVRITTIGYVPISEVLVKLQENIEYRLDREQIKYNKRKINLNIFCTEIQDEIKIIKSLTYYLKKINNGKHN